MVLVFGSESCALSDAITHAVEGTHVGFLIHIPGEQSWIQAARIFGGDAVIGQVHWLPAGDSGAVVGPTPNPGGLLEGNMLRGKGLGAKVMVEAENYLGDTVELVGGGSMGGGQPRQHEGGGAAADRG